MGIAAGKLQRDPPQHTESDQHQECRQAARGLDHVHRYAPGAGRAAPGGRQHDVLRELLSQLRLRHQPGQRRPDRLEVRSGAGQVLALGGLLRSGEQGRRLCRRENSGHHAGHACLRAGREDRQGGLDRLERRSATGPDHDHGSPGGSRQSDRRHLRRRVRRARLSQRVRPQNRQAGVARQQRRSRPGHTV